MAKLQIKAEGTTKDCIDELALIMLQHERTREIVLGAAVKTMAIEALGVKAKMDQVSDQMKQFIKGN
jgi:hypothetical protein